MDPALSRIIHVEDYVNLGLDMEIDLGDSQILGTIMPDSLKEELRVHLNNLYAGEKEGVGIRREWLNNAQRKLPCGTMGCFMRKSKDDNYSSCREDRFGARGSLFSTLHKLCSGFGAFFQMKFPQVWNEIRNNNAKEGWSTPSFLHHEHICSPRIFITDCIGNESHKDFHDIGPCVVFWIKESPEDEESDWQFIFEAVSTGEGDCKRDLLTIQINDGLVLVFDGRKVRHCTSIPDPNSKRKYAVYHGASKVR